jgi:hypothetical protein
MIMKKDTIVQFVCFETAIGMDEFIPEWEQYAKQFLSKKIEVTLQQRIVSANRFKYLSQHKWSQDDFQFLFMKGRHSEYFPERRVKVIQAGGYTPLQIECVHDNEINAVKIFVLINDATSDIEHYKKFEDYHYLNIYQAYYESSMYAYILEFFVDEASAETFMLQLKAKVQGVEAGIYKECLVLEK